MGLREQGYVRAVCWLAPSLSLVATIDRRCRARIPLPVWFLVYCGLPPCLPLSTAAPSACSPCAGLRARSPLPRLRVPLLAQPHYSAPQPQTAPRGLLSLSCIPSRACARVRGLFKCD